jgi:anti-sigma regulatory factor (Ser/Thr protein kinase)
LLRAGIDGRVGSEIATAANEAFLNAVQHPLDRATDQIEVEGEVGSGEVVVRVRDDGLWNAELDPDRPHFGLGLIAALTDSVKIEREASGSVVTLRRKLRTT